MWMRAVQEAQRQSEKMRGCCIGSLVTVSLLRLLLIVAADVEPRSPPQSCRSAIRGLRSNIASTSYLTRPSPFNSHGVSASAGRGVEGRMGSGDDAPPSSPPDEGDTRREPSLVLFLHIPRVAGKSFHSCFLKPAMPSGAWCLPSSYRRVEAPSAASYHADAWDHL